MADQKHIVIISTGSIQVLGGLPDPYLFRPGQPNIIFDENATTLTLSAYGVKRLVFLYENSSIGNAFFSATSPKLEAVGINVTGIPMPSNQTDFAVQAANANTLVSRILSEQGNASAASTAVLETSCICFCECNRFITDNVIRHASEFGSLSKVRWFSLQAELDTRLLENSTVAAFLAKTQFTAITPYVPTTPQSLDFVNRYVAQYGIQPEPVAKFAYDAAWLAMLAILLTQNHNSLAISAAIPIVANRYFGATGTGTYLNTQNDVSFTYFALDRVQEAASTHHFEQVGIYDGITNELRFSVNS